MQLDHLYDVQLCKYLQSQALSVPQTHRTAATSVNKLMVTNMFFSLAFWLRIIFTVKKGIKWIASFFYVVNTSSR